MKRSNSILAIVLALSLVSALVLSACDSGSNNNTGGNAGNNASNSTSFAAGAPIATAVPSSRDPVTLKVGAAQVPHAELLNYIKPELAKKGVNLEIIVPTDESQLNQLTDSGELDVNYFQHQPYLDSVVAEKKFDLVTVAGIHVEPIGAYSDTYTSKSQIADGDTIAIPNDGTNEYRALKILEAAGLITLKPNTNPVTTTKSDIATNPKNLNIVELEAGLIVRTHDEYKVYITNTNRIIEAGLDANKNIFREGADSPYANILVVKSANKNSPAVKLLIEALETNDVKSFIDTQYKGAVIPAF